MDSAQYSHSIRITWMNVWIISCSTQLDMKNILYLINKESKLEKV